MNDETTVRNEDVYQAQREEFFDLIQDHWEKGSPLVVHGQALLSAQALRNVLRKIRQGDGFSRDERAAFTEAGFQLDKIFPDL